MKVLIALDHSTAAREAARRATDLLAPMGADFFVLDVCQPSTSRGVLKATDRPVLVVPERAA